MSYGTNSLIEGVLGTGFLVSIKVYGVLWELSQLRAPRRIHLMVRILVDNIVMMVPIYGYYLYYLVVVLSSSSDYSCTYIPGEPNYPSIEEYTLNHKVNFYLRYIP